MKLTAAPTEQEIEDEDYEEDKKRSGSFFTEGRSRVTGY